MTVPCKLYFELPIVPCKLYFELPIVPCKLYFVLPIVPCPLSLVPCPFCILYFPQKVLGYFPFFVILPLGNAELQVGSLLIPSITNN